MSPHYHCVHIGVFLELYHMVPLTRLQHCYQIACCMVPGENSGDWRRGQMGWLVHFVSQITLCRLVKVLTSLPCCSLLRKVGSVPGMAVLSEGH